VNAWLTQHGGNFFVFGDATMLYGLHRRPSPQPWLYLLDGHSYLHPDSPQVDQIVTASLKRGAIQTVILEEVSWGGGQDVDWLPRLPKLQEWIGSNFHKEREFGIYEIWMANSH
jgi:hypothetical protein